MTCITTAICEVIFHSLLILTSYFLVKYRPHYVVLSEIRYIRNVVQLQSSHLNEQSYDMIKTAS